MATFPSTPEKQDASVETDYLVQIKTFHCLFRKAKLNSFCIQRPKCEQLCANLEACGSCLYHTKKFGEFVIDESPGQKRIGSMILESYETIV